MDLKRSAQLMSLSTGQGVRIAVLDSGVDPKIVKPSRGQVFDCAQFPEGVSIEPISNQLSSDRNGHGSLVQHCIASVAPDAEIDHYRILDENNKCDIGLLCHVLDAVIEKKYHIVNLSLGTRNEEYIPWLVSIMKRAYENNVTLVSASSNIGNVLFPARFTYCISVEAITAENPFKLQFRPNSVVEFGGWGVDVPMGNIGGEERRVTGSSYAAGFVTGLAARLIEGAEWVTPLDVKLLLREYAFSCLENEGGRGGKKALN